MPSVLLLIISIIGQTTLSEALSSMSNRQASPILSPPWDPVLSLSLSPAIASVPAVSSSEAALAHEQQISELRAENDALRQQLLGATADPDARQEEWSRQIDEMRTANAELRRQIASASYQQKLGKALAANAELQHQLDEVRSGEAEIEELTRRLSAAVDSGRAHEAEAEELRHKLQSVASKLAAKTTKGRDDAKVAAAKAVRKKNDAKPGRAENAQRVMQAGKALKAEDVKVTKLENPKRPTQHKMPDEQIAFKPVPSQITGFQNNLLCWIRQMVGLRGSVYSESFGRMKSKFGTCSVVSSSGVLSAHHYGESIDSADLVIRFNAAPINGFESVVGSKEGIRFVNNQFIPRALGEASSARDEEVMQKHSDLYKVHSNISYVVVPMAPVPEVPQFHHKFPETEVYVLDGLVHDSISTTLRNIYGEDVENAKGVSFIPTTGAVGMFVAMTLCDTVWAFGMAATPSAADAPYNYFSPEVYAGKADAPANPWHKTFSAEKDLWRRLATNPADEIDESEVAIIPGLSHARCSVLKPAAQSWWESIAA